MPVKYFGTVRFTLFLGADAHAEVNVRESLGWLNVRKRHEACV